MNPDTKDFLKNLALLTLATGAALAVFHFLAPPVRAHWKFSIGLLTVFAGLCAGLFFVGRRLAEGRDKYAFNHLISLSVFGKLGLSFALLFAYRALEKPENQWFVGLFLLVYVVYTVFEVAFMTRLARR